MQAVSAKILHRLMAQREMRVLPVSLRGWQRNHEIRSTDSEATQPEKQQVQRIQETSDPLARGQPAQFDQMRVRLAEVAP
jgi:hypothetical protein